MLVACPRLLTKSCGGSVMAVPQPWHCASVTGSSGWQRWDWHTRMVLVVIAGTPKHASQQTRPPCCGWCWEGVKVQGWLWTNRLKIRVFTPGGAAPTADSDCQRPRAERGWLGGQLRNTCLRTRMCFHSSPARLCPRKVPKPRPVATGPSLHSQCPSLPPSWAPQHLLELEAAKLSPTQSQVASTRLTPS